MDWIFILYTLDKDICNKKAPIELGAYPLLGRFGTLDTPCNYYVGDFNMFAGTTQEQTLEIRNPSQTQQDRFSASESTSKKQITVIQLMMSKSHVHIVNDEIVVLVIMAEPAPTSHVGPEVELVG